jgi:DNA-binding LytR/AlgR family response regulator
MTPVIFTTAFDSYMQQAFKVHSIDYLLKPINPLELQAALSKFKRLLATPIEQAVPVSEKAQTAEKFKERFIGTAGTKIFSFRTSEIAYFLIEERATFLRLFDGRHFAVEYSLEKLSQLLNPADFFRINRTMIISVNAIRQMQTNALGKLRIDLNPSLSQEVIVSADRSADFKIWLGK